MQHTAQIFPPRLRAVCCGITTTVQWIAQVAVAFATPLLMVHLGWLT